MPVNIAKRTDAKHIATATGAELAGAIDGSLITALAAANITPGGTLPVLDGTALTGKLAPDGDGNLLTNLNPANLGTGTLPTANFPGGGFNGASELLQLDASGYVPDANFPGGAFNGINQIVKLDAATALPAVDGNNVTNLNPGNLASGAIPTANFPGGGFNGANELVQLDASGHMPAIDGSALTAVEAVGARYIHGIDSLTNHRFGSLDPDTNGWRPLDANEKICSNNQTTSMDDSGFHGDGSDITNIDADNIAAGGTLAAIDGGALTNLTADNIASGGTFTAINGSALTNLTAGNLTANGTFPAMNGSALYFLPVPGITTVLTSNNDAGGNAIANVVAISFSNNYTPLLNVPQIYSYSNEVWVMDAANNQTQISPHATDAPAALYRQTPGKEIVYHSRNDFHGEIEYINLSALAKKIDALTPGQSPCCITEKYADHNARTGSKRIVKKWDEEGRKNPKPAFIK